METTLIFLGILLALIIAMELSTLLVYGFFVNKHITKLFMNLDESSLKLNDYDNSILQTRPYITNVPFSLFSYYHINGLGTVPRWSKLHNRINEYYAIAIKNNHQTA